jgi:hypothetical protein
MASSKLYETQLQASKILCDLSQHDCMHGTLHEAGCVEVLIQLVTHGYEGNVVQHAVHALANLSSSLCCQVYILYCIYSIIF